MKDYEVIYRGKDGEIDAYLEKCRAKKAPCLIFKGLYRSPDMEGIYFKAIMLDSQGVTIEGMFPVVAAKYFGVALQDIVDMAEFSSKEG